MAQTVRHRLTAGRATLLVAFLAFVVLGLPDGTLGVAWPSIRATFDQPLSGLGALLIAFTVGYFAASATGGRLAEGLGIGALLTLAATSGLVGLVVFAVAAAWWTLLPASLLIGAAGGWYDAGLNSYVALNHSVRTMNLLHASFGLGAMVGPLVVTLLLGLDLSWRLAYVVLAVLELVLAVLFVRTRHRWAGGPPASTPSESDEPGDAQRRRSLLVLTLVLFFVYAGLEVSAGQWSFSLFVEERGFAETSAGLWVAAYWGSLTAGRVAVGLLGHRLTPQRLLDLSVVGATAGTAMLWWDPVGVVAPAGLLLTGLSLAAVFPTLVSLTPERLGAGRTTAAIGYQVAAAGLGGSLIPAFAGVVADRTSLEAIGPVLVASSIAVVVLHAMTSRRVPDAIAID